MDLRKRANANAFDVQNYQFYDDSATFGNVDEISASKEALLKDLDLMWEQVKEENNRRMEKALTAFAGIACVAFTALILDKMSDYTCDWWSDTCVQASKILVLFYTAVLGILGWQVNLMFVVVAVS